jgi:hypothetical protein
MMYTAHHTKHKSAVSGLALPLEVYRGQYLGAMGH